MPNVGCCAVKRIDGDIVEIPIDNIQPFGSGYLAKVDGKKIILFKDPTGIFKEGKIIKKQKN